jgi:D-alanine-D-alanine ligase
MPALTVARDKTRAKLLLRGAGLPTASFFAVDQLPVPQCNLEWPVIAKPAQQDASVGLAQDSVCTDQDQLERRVRYLLETYGPVLVEEYIAGREFNVALLELPELQYLAPAEIMFPDDRPGQWAILTYDGKWKPGTPEYDTTPPRFPADISPATARKLGAIAIAAYRQIGCRDYARVDLRMKANGRAYLLEVNPNPEISPTAGFAGCLGAAAIPHKDFVVRLIEQALSRKDHSRPTFALSRPLA